MSRKNRKSDARIRVQFVPLFFETLRSPAYRQLSFGARALFTALHMRFFLNDNNNGRIFLSQRDAGEELGHKKRSHIANWYRELQHYGFIVQTSGASLGVDGKGKAPHWRITDLPTRSGNGELDLATKDFLRWDGVLFEPHVAPSNRWNVRKQAGLKKQNPGLHVGTTVDSTSVPLADSTSVPPGGGTGTNGESISALPTGTNGEPISRLATGSAGKRRGTQTKRRRGQKENPEWVKFVTENPDCIVETACGYPMGGPGYPKLEAAAERAGIDIETYWKNTSNNIDG